jgi:amino-acid N-acetyltransferase
VETKQDIVVRRARIGDVTTCSRIINDYAELGLMLHRSLAYLYEHLRDFHVAVVPLGDAGKPGGEDEQVIGIAGLNIIWANIAEVYSVAVAPAFQGMGVGKRLVQACIDEAAELGIRRLMTLTYERLFFEKLGFGVVDRMSLPLKVWSECIRCSKNQACDEIAMIRELAGVPEVEAPPPYQPPPGEYSVPVTLQLSAVQARPKMDEAH